MPRWDGASELVSNCADRLSLEYTCTYSLPEASPLVRQPTPYRFRISPFRGRRRRAARRQSGSHALSLELRRLLVVKKNGATQHAEAVCCDHDAFFKRHGGRPSNPDKTPASAGTPTEGAVRDAQSSSRSRAALLCLDSPRK